MDARAFLEGASARAREAYGRELRLLTFDRYLDLFLQDPYALGRSAVQYIVDAVDHFGVRKVPGIGGAAQRYGLFDAPFAGGRGAVHGQEEAQERIVRLMRSAAEDGRLDRLVVLHGPNGSAKTTLVECLMRGVAHYSTLAEGALYRFHWVFPRRDGVDAGLGFASLGRGGPAPADGQGESFAMLDPEEIAARVPCELRDDPMLLLPAPIRAEVLADACGRRKPSRSLRHLETGDLCPKCRSIADALLAGYRGDLRRLLRHVQVERWFVDPRFRSGAVVVPPQQSVDAHVREFASGPSASSLPPLLHHATLHEASGDLVDANRGILEFSDFLKRPVELWKYLLSTTEKGTVPVGPFLAHLNLVMLATANDKYIDAFKSSPDWTSFKARIELVAVPYLREPRKEEPVYRDFAAALAPDRHVAPHVLSALARFAVMTRLLRPEAERYPEEIRPLVESLKPADKLRLYESGEPPDGLEETRRRALLAALPDLRDETRDALDYEGRQGASAREMRVVLAAAAADPEAAGCLHPRVVFRHLRELLREKTVYEFLRLEIVEGYHRAEEFAKEAEEECRRRALEDLQDALELVPPGEYERRFERYVAHAIASTQRERVRNPVSGSLEAPDEEVMSSVERLMRLKDSPSSFRRNLVSRIGAFGVDNPGKRPELKRLFPEVLRALREDYFTTVKDRLRRMEVQILAFGTPEFERLEKPQQDLVRRALDNLQSKRGYCAVCAREAVAAVKRFVEQ